MKLSGVRIEEGIIIGVAVAVIVGMLVVAYRDLVLSTDPTGQN